MKGLTTTANGALTYDSSLDTLVDLFFQGGALRTKPDTFVNYFKSAFSVNKLNAIKVLFYLRDIRGGQGERNVFKHTLKVLAKEETDAFLTVLNQVPVFGRWSDLWPCLGINISVDSAIFELVRAQLEKDLDSETPSLLAKWLPSINATCKQTRKDAEFFRYRLGLNHKDYRKTLSALRRKIGVVEQLTCANKWSDINYAHVPSGANKMYNKAFLKHDTERRLAFIAKVEKGVEKIHSSTLYPYDIFEKVRATRDQNEQRSLDALWKALPNYCEGTKFNGLVVADTSGSMNGRPLAVSVSLAIYLAERLNGAFKDCWMNFSNEPTFQTVTGNTIAEKIANMDYQNWDQSTNLQAVFELILGRALSNNVPQEDMPDSVIIISDMQFNKACGHNMKTNLEAIREKYKNSNYVMPNLVFWNVNSGGDSPARFDENGVKLVSGCSPSIFTQIAGNVNGSPIDFVLKTISGDRYKIFDTLFTE